MLRLRDYQRASLDALSAAWARGGADDAAPGHLIVLPTGAGKALVIAALARETLEQDPLARVAIVTHSRELVAQNFSELSRAWPEAPAGIFSAGSGGGRPTRRCWSAASSRWPTGSTRWGPATS